MSWSVKARRLDSFADLSSFTPAAGLVVSSFRRTASPKQMRNTFTAKFAVERESSLASWVAEPGTIAFSQRGQVALGLGVTEKAGEAFEHALVTGVCGLLGLDCFGFRPRFAPRFDGRTRQRFRVGRHKNIAHALRDDCARAVLAQ